MGLVSLREAETPGRARSLSRTHTEERPRENTVRPRLPAGKRAPPAHLPAGELGETRPPLCTPPGLWPAVTGSPGRQTPPPSELKVNAPPGPAESLRAPGQLRPRWQQSTCHPTSVVTNYYKPRDLKQHRFIFFQCPGGQELETGALGLEAWCWQGWFLRAAPEENP